MEIKNVDSILCRICCKFCSQNVEPVDDLTKKMLIKLLLNPDIFITEAPFICTICVESIERCYYFKLSCLYTEKTINSYASHNPNTKCDLSKIYLNNNGEKSRVPEDHIICRLCMVSVESGSCWHITDEIEDTTKLIKMLGQHFSELDLSTTEDPAICINCLTSLQKYFEFVKYCLQSTLSDIKAEPDIDTLNKEYKVNHTSQFTPSYAMQLGNKYDYLSYGKNEVGSEYLEEQEDVKLDIKDVDLHRDHNLNYCNICFYKAESLRALQKHMKSHTNIKTNNYTYVCSFCGYKTEYESMLERHLETYHLKQPKLEVTPCDVCLHGAEASKPAKSFARKELNTCDSCQFRRKLKEKFKFHTVASGR